MTVGGPVDARDPAIRFEGATRAYDGRPAVDGVTLSIPRASFAVILGPSGCGKTTLLKTVNRLLELTSGRVFVDGVDVAGVDATALRRRVGYVIQQVGLFPHMTVAENVAVVPTLLGWPRERVAARVDELLALVHLEPIAFRARLPRQLSGGQQQRVGLARALAGDPGIILMDEPFGAVDAIVRARLQDEMIALQRRLRKTILFITHDVDEALRLADLLVVMRDGRIAQASSPADVICSPASGFVSELVGSGDVVRRLSVLTAGRAADRSEDAPAGPQIDASATLRDALSSLAASGASRLSVVESGAHIGSLSVERLLTAARAPTAARSAT